MIDRMYVEPMERFNDSISVSSKTGCWSWDKHLIFGYGSLSIRGKVFRAHRFSYLIFNGPLKEGLVIDHLCRNRSCVNPEHLEQVSQRENTKRGRTGARTLKTHCPRGHPKVGSNAAERKGTNSKRCRVCSRKYSREWMRKKIGVKKPYIN